MIYTIIKITKMINLKFNNEIYPLKNEIHEISVGEYEKITEISLDSELDSIEKWSRIFNLLGAPTNAIDEMDSQDFMKIIREFSLVDTTDNIFQKTIELKGEKYHSHVDDFKISVKEMKLIEHYVKQNRGAYLAEFLAVILKRSDIDSKLHYDNAHIKYKAELIRKEITADIALPYLTYLTKNRI